ncbi:hypothetical protein [Pseudomonas agarici]|uniref:hypothetical protein n=1 Tax=Pseudomonas agarici TaxID=46677 RepID=UPI0012E34EC6|nr:hypothetical protein [Pseudomonas agarici]NWB93569.1 hypothetical protein [Pseudomonas agarici]
MTPLISVSNRNCAESSGQANSGLPCIHHEINQMNSAKKDTLSTVKSCLLYAKALTEEEREMIELTLAYIQYKSHEKAKYTLTQDIWGTPKGVLSYGYYNIINNEIYNLSWCKIEAAQVDLINKTYKSKTNIMNAVASEACDAFLDNDDPLATEFKNFIKEQPKNYAPDAFRLTDTFWKKRIEKGNNEGIHTDISNAIKYTDGSIRIAYIMMYLSTEIKSFDFLFVEYNHTKTNVILNGFSLKLDLEEWREVKSKIKKELGPKDDSFAGVDFSL